MRSSSDVRRRVGGFPGFSRAGPPKAQGFFSAANKIKGVRCALGTDAYLAKMTRLQNDANILAMGGGFTGPNLAVEIVDTFLDTEFSQGENHKRRISKIEP